MNQKYIEALSKLNQVNIFRPGKLDLGNMQNMAKRLGNPQDKLKFIHVAGTNGKGSVTLKVQKVLQHSGFKTGLFISPHLFTFRERIMINDQKIDQDFLTSEINSLFVLAEKYKIPLSFFEYLTCLAFIYFRDQKVDYVALETGLGGRLDATNIVETTILSIITSIALDHTSILGNSLREIAYEKAGIIKQGVPVLIGPNAKPYDVFEQEALKNNSVLTKVKDKGYTDFDSENSEIVKVAFDILKNQQSSFFFSDNLPLNTSEENVEKGIQARQCCRMELIEQSLNKKCQVIVDVGHNPNALERLFLSLKKSAQRPIVIYGTSSQKDATSSIQILKKFCKEIYLIQAKHFRSMPIDALILQSNSDNQYLKYLTSLIRDNTIQIVGNGNINQTILRVLETQADEQTVVICGSFFIMREVMETFQIEIDADPFELNERNMVK